MTNPAACPQGHEYTVANTYYDPAGYIHCRKCSNIRTKARYHRRKAERAAAMNRPNFGGVGGGLD